MDAKMKEFLVKVSQDEALKKELLDKLGDDASEAKEAIRKVAVTIASFAKDKGIDIDAKKVLLNTLKVDDEALDEIAGGRVFIGDDGKAHGDCMCAVGGGGAANEYQDTCACPVFGMGFLTDAGAALLNYKDNFCADALYCLFAGAPALYNRTEK